MSAPNRDLEADPCGISLALPPCACYQAQASWIATVTADRDQQDPALASVGLAQSHIVVGHVVGHVAGALWVQRLPAVGI